MSEDYSKRHTDFLKWVGDRVETESDQQKGVECPPVQKPYPEGAELIRLPGFDEFRDICNINLIDAINDRRSHRQYTEESLSQKELAFLLWATQGFREMRAHSGFRTVPSAGCRHPFVTYLYINRVEGLDRGIYRYLPIDHALIFEKTEPDLEQKMTDGCLGQQMAGKAAVTFIWTVIPYRTEWRYQWAGHKAIVLDAGHVCQNLYLAVEAIGCGTCAIGAYSNEKMDALLELDGEEEFTIYVSPVGKLEK